MSAPLPAPRELLARSDSGARYSAVLPATTTRVTLTASDATTVRPRVAERDRLRCATNPGMPNSLPAMPAKRPIGTPTAPSSSASASTVLRSCRFEAPREASSPNCRVRSATEMANAL